MILIGVYFLIRYANREKNTIKSNSTTVISSNVHDEIVESFSTHKIYSVKIVSDESRHNATINCIDKGSLLN